MNKDKTYDWYRQLRKPAWAPPSWLFGPVWTFLYIVIAISFGYAIYLYVHDLLPFVVLLPFFLNLAFNFAFTPLQFRLRSNFLASIDIVLVLGTLVWALFAIYPIAAWVSFVNIPYLLWVSFATILQLTITIMNKSGKGSRE